MKRALVLFSGGKDSLLSTILLIEKGYQVYLVHYDNMHQIGSNNIKKGIDRLIKKYGNDKVKFMGIKNISAIFRNFIKDFYVLKPKEISEKYGQISVSEFNCLSCRLAMYIATIIICKQNDIKVVADGARKSQLFAIEQEGMLSLFEELFKTYNIDIVFPVKDIASDYELKNELIIRGIIPKVNESQCLLGLPLKSDDVDKEHLEASINIFNNILKEKAIKIIEKYKNIDIGEEFI